MYFTNGLKFETVFSLDKNVVSWQFFAFLNNKGMVSV